MTFQLEHMSFNFRRLPFVDYEVVCIRIAWYYKRYFREMTQNLVWFEQLLTHMSKKAIKISLVLLS